MAAIRGVAQARPDDPGVHRPRTRSQPAYGQTYPSKVIRIVVPTGPGTPPDVISRVIGAELSESDGWRVSIENRPGALQTIGMADVLKQPADGYSIYPMSVPTMAVPALLPNMGLRPDADFTPIIKVSKSYNAAGRTAVVPGAVCFRAGLRS